MRISIPDSIVGLDAYFDFYRYPSPHSGPAPLLIWAGGAIPPQVYEERRNSEPEAILVELDKARLALGDDPFDAVILSTPPTLHQLAEAPELFFELIVKEVIPRLPIPTPPSRLGLVGNSFGAFLVTHLACSLAVKEGELPAPQVRGLATIAGVGLWEAVSTYPDGLPEGLAFRCYANDDDFAGVYATELEIELSQRGRSIELIERPGDHAFADYAANGSVAEAFEFVLRALVRA